MIQKKNILTLAILITLFISICFLASKIQEQNSIGSAKSSSANPAKLNVKSSAYGAGDTIPVKYVCSKIPGGENVSIPVEWCGAPSETKSFAVFMYDLNPVAKNFVHWSVINIPSDINHLQEGASLTSYMPAGSIELKNSSGTVGYTGPCPPAGTKKHEYKIIIYALNTEKLNLSGFVPVDKFQSAIAGKVLAQGEISGFFEQ